MFDSAQMKTFQYRKLFYLTIILREAFEIYKKKEITDQSDELDPLHWSNDTLVYSAGHVFFKELIKQVKKINYFTRKHQEDIKEYFRERLPNVPEQVWQTIERVIDEPFELRKKKEETDQDKMDILMGLRKILTGQDEK